MSTTVTGFYHITGTILFVVWYTEVGLKVAVNTIVPRSRFLLCVPQNTDCYKHKIKCGRMSASMKWRHLGHLQPLSKAKYSLTAMAKKEV